MAVGELAPVAVGVDAGPVVLVAMRTVIVAVVVSVRVGVGTGGVEDATLVGGGVAVTVSGGEDGLTVTVAVGGSTVVAAAITSAAEIRPSPFQSAAAHAVGPAKIASTATATRPLRVCAEQSSCAKAVLPAISPTDDTSTADARRCPNGLRGHLFIRCHAPMLPYRGPGMAHTGPPAHRAALRLEVHLTAG